MWVHFYMLCGCIIELGAMNGYYVGIVEHVVMLWD